MEAGSQHWVLFLRCRPHCLDHWVNWGFLIRLDWQATESQGSSCPSCPGQQHFTDYLSPRPNMYIILGSSSATR